MGLFSLIDDYEPDMGIGFRNYHGSFCLYSCYLHPKRWSLGGFRARV